MKTSRVCPGMLSSENDDFKFLKTAKHIKKNLHHVHYSSRARETVFISPNQSVVDPKHERKSSHRAVLYIFKKYRNLDTGYFSLTLSAPCCVMFSVCRVLSKTSTYLHPETGIKA